MQFRVYIIKYVGARNSRGFNFFFISYKTKFVVKIWHFDKQECLSVEDLPSA